SSRTLRLLDGFGELEAERNGLDDARNGAPGALRPRHARFLVNPRRHTLDVPGQTDRLHGADGVPRDVEFPPVEAVARGALVAMVVVVPPLADGEERGERIVPRLVDRV